MQNETIRIYENTTDKDISVLGVGVIPAHDRISVKTEFHAPVNLTNYPGVVDVLAAEAEGVPAKAPATTKSEGTSIPVNSGLSGNLETEKTEGK